ncbi:Uu.00g107170.m01.CDS01 [Anthostomella pinea]|uniref:Uu.00g107170.m01.CDS01 n=1 Tax=Anthostomella pinea TaxID=933095 RepID=A0AAI8VF93_9PEZI|nr:Uu.00g107170.m01.CDS01 [Anthostomella pinea]
MSIRIVLDKQPEFYTNLDFISGRVLLSLHRPENIGNVIVKLEGESRTALTVPMADRDDYTQAGAGSVVSETHKILYRLFRVYPDDGAHLPFQPGQHEFKFNFKVPLNNICHDPKAMGALMGIGGAANSSGLLGMGGFRTMDGTRQLMLQHVKSTLPPSLTGFPQEAEIRYYIKVTIQRPGIFKENWRYQLGFKFSPIEPPRPVKTTQEAFARRPFNFRPRAPAPAFSKKSLFGSSKPTATPNADTGGTSPPSIEMSARIPFPTILTCNEPLPLRLFAKKLAPTPEQVYLTAFEIVLVGYTAVRVQSLENVERSTWVVLSAPNLSMALGTPADAVDTEFEVSNSLWSMLRLPNTVAPSFRTCNLARRYEIQMKLSLSWGLPSGSGKGKSTAYPEVISLPLKLSNVEVYSGVKPPAQLVQAQANRPPRPPPRQSATQSTPLVPQPRPSDPLYPPQLGPNNVPAYDDAPPSYDEAIADSVGGPQERPAYSGVTAENAPSTSKQLVEWFYAPVWTPKSEKFLLQTIKRWILKFNSGTSNDSVVFLFG